MSSTAITPRLGAAGHWGAVGLPGLAAHWHLALDIAEAAVTASLRAELLPPDYCAEEFKHLRAESRWLEHAPLA
jgi:hypothetical protein